MDASRIRRVLIPICILCAGAWLLRTVTTHAVAKTRADSATIATSPAHDPAPTTVSTSSTRTALASAPLPPADAPVAQIFGGLKQRADAGDAHAACRLAVELIRCRDLPMMEAVAGVPSTNGDDNEAAFARKGNLAAANFFAQGKLDVIEARRRCKNISTKQTALAAPYLRQAARAGIGDAIVRYVDGQAFDPRAMFGVLQDPSFDAWRREAPALAMRALHQGNPAAVFQLYSAYVGDSSLFAGLVRDDPVQARAYRVLMERLRNRTARPDTSLTPEQQATADMLAARMFHDDFHGAPLPDGQDASNDLPSAAATDCR
jgi:hypothetical protein